jgi:hypothetical protein
MERRSRGVVACTAGHGMGDVPPLMGRRHGGHRGFDSVGRGRPAPTDHPGAQSGPRIESSDRMRRCVRRACCRCERPAAFGWAGGPPGQGADCIHLITAVAVIAGTWRSAVMSDAPSTSAAATTRRSPGSALRCRGTHWTRSAMAASECRGCLLPRNLPRILATRAGTSHQRVAKSTAPGQHALHATSIPGAGFETLAAHRHSCSS